MSKILLQTTISDCFDDWGIDRFALLAGKLRTAGHEVVARNRSDKSGDDPILSRLDELGFDQLWLMAVDSGDALTAADAEAILRFRCNGGGVLTARDHQDLGCCVLRLGSLGRVNQFHDPTVDQRLLCDDKDTPSICWPNYHSGANGDYQPVFAEEPPARTAAHQPHGKRAHRMVSGAPARRRGVRHGEPAAWPSSPTTFATSRVGCIPRRWLGRRRTPTMSFGR